MWHPLIWKLKLDKASFWIQATNFEARIFIMTLDCKIGLNFCILHNNTYSTNSLNYLFNSWQPCLGDLIIERFGIANTEYRYIGIKISVNTGISPAFGVFLRKQIELRNADKNKFWQNFYVTRTILFRNFAIALRWKTTFKELNRPSVILNFVFLFINVIIDNAGLTWSSVLIRQTVSRSEIPKVRFIGIFELYISPIPVSEHIPVYRIYPVYRFSLPH